MTKKIKWLNVYDIAIYLEELYPDEDIVNISFMRLQKLVLDLETFDDESKNCNEKVLEAIQQTWIDERS